MNTPEYTSFVKFAVESVRYWNTTEFRTLTWDEQEADDKWFDRETAVIFRNFVLNHRHVLAHRDTRESFLRELVTDVVTGVTRVLDTEEFPTIGQQMFRAVEVFDRAVFLNDDITRRVFNEAAEILVELARAWSEDKKIA